MSGNIGLNDEQFKEDGPVSWVDKLRVVSRTGSAVGHGAAQYEQVNSTRSLCTRVAACAYIQKHNTVKGLLRESDHTAAVLGKSGVKQHQLAVSHWTVSTFWTTAVRQNDRLSESVAAVLLYSCHAGSGSCSK